MDLRHQLEKNEDLLLELGKHNFPNTYKLMEKAKKLYEAVVFQRSETINSKNYMNYSFIQKYKKYTCERIFSVRICRKTYEVKEIIRRIFGISGWMGMDCYLSNSWYSAGITVAWTPMQIYGNYNRYRFLGWIPSYNPGSFNYRMYSQEYMDDSIHPTWSWNKLSKLIPKIKFCKNIFITGHERYFFQIGVMMKHPIYEMIQKLNLENYVSLEHKAFIKKLENDKAFKKYLFQNAKAINPPNEKERVRNFVHFDSKDIISAYRMQIPFGDYAAIGGLRKKWIVDDPKKIIKYIKKQKTTGKFYNDYLEMVDKMNHDTNDPYWRYPNNLNIAHQKILDQINNAAQAEDEFECSKIPYVVAPLIKNNSNVDGYDIYIPNNIDDITNQAKVLNQCLLANGYHKRLINQESILVFIKKDNKPLATAEIDYFKNVLQIYTNQKNYTRENADKCHPSKAVQEAFDKWLDMAIIKKEKVILPKRTFWKALYEGNTPFNYSSCHIKYEEGKEYKTQTNSMELVKLGSKALASNNVFHFCRTKNDTKYWVTSPKAYAEVEVLGGLVHNEGSGAYGSNHIKILRIIPA